MAQAKERSKSKFQFADRQSVKSPELFAQLQRYQFTTVHCMMQERTSVISLCPSLWFVKNSLINPDRQKVFLFAFVNFRHSLAMEWPWPWNGHGMSPKLDLYWGEHYRPEMEVPTIETVDLLPLSYIPGRTLPCRTANNWCLSREAESKWFSFSAFQKMFWVKFTQRQCVQKVQDYFLPLQNRHVHQK